MRPQLLVSLRSVDELACLPTEACDIIDVKDPSRGSLGMADVAVIRGIADSTPAERLSFALGEVSDPMTRAPVSLPRTGFRKLGLSGLREVADWRERWLRRREAFGGAAENWVAVAYADATAAAAPEIDEVVQAAVESGCRAVLVDTFRKDGRSLFDLMTVGELRRHCRAARDADLLFAIAGQLRSNHLALVAAVGPDVVGIRGAACRSGDRGAHIAPQAILEFREQLDAATRAKDSAGRVIT